MVQLPFCGRSCYLRSLHRPGKFRFTFILRKYQGGQFRTLLLSVCHIQCRLSYANANKDSLLQSHPVCQESSMAFSLLFFLVLISSIHLLSPNLPFVVLDLLCTSATVGPSDLYLHPCRSETSCLSTVQ